MLLEETLFTDLQDGTMLNILSFKGFKEVVSCWCRLLEVVRGWCGIRTICEIETICLTVDRWKRCDQVGP